MSLLGVSIMAEVTGFEALRASGAQASRMLGFSSGIDTTLASQVVLVRKGLFLIGIKEG